jgi:Zn-dependent peptidase ImmA (M78 family)
MTATNNEESILFKLRRFVPNRPLTRIEAFRLAELQAEKLLRMHDVHDAGTPDSIITGQPFIMVNLRRDMPVGASGSTTWIKPRWVILLNQTEPAQRRRFSLWHEFAHILAHDTADTIYRDLSGRDVEAVADYFAACVLMPRRIVKRLFGQGHHDPGDLAAMFGVSEPAMRYRLSALGLTERYARCPSPAPVSRGSVRYFRTGRLALTF